MCVRPNKCDSSDQHYSPFISLKIYVNTVDVDGLAASVDRLSVTKLFAIQDAFPCFHYNDVIIGVIASQITSRTIVFSTVYLDTYQRKHQSSGSPAFVRGIHRRPMNSPHKWPVTRKMFPFDDVIMFSFMCHLNVEKPKRQNMQTRYKIKRKIHTFLLSLFILRGTTRTLRWSQIKLLAADWKSPRHICCWFMKNRAFQGRWT